jgi:hypothetical protein
MLYSSWLSLCEKLDEALLPATQTKRRSLIFFVLLLFVSFALLLIGFVSVGSESTAFIAFYLSAFAILVLGILLIMCRTSYVRKQVVYVNLCKICDDASAEHTDITFEVKKDRYMYIKVSISNGYMPPEEQVEAGGSNQTKPLLGDEGPSKKSEDNV